MSEQRSIISLAEELAERISNGESLAIAPYHLLQNLAAQCEIEMLNRTMPECAYAEEML